MGRLKFKLIGVKMGMGAATPGTEQAYEVLRPHIKRVKPARTVSVQNATGKAFDQQMKCFSDIKQSVSQTYDEGLFPLVIGGDHSLSIGTLSASSERYDNLCVFWVDAHTDINDDAHSPSGQVHGMPLASALGLCSKELTLQGGKIDPHNVFIIGARSVDVPEWDNIRKLGVNVYTMHEIVERGWKAVLVDICAKATARNAHISFDVDALDPKCFISTGYNVDNGFTIKEVTNVLRDLVREFNPVLFECVEYNPTLDTGKEYKKVAKIINNTTKFIR